MNKMQSYNRVISEIIPERSNSELLDAVIRKAENTMVKKRINNRSAMIPIMVAVALICTACAATVVYYEHLTILFGENKTLSSEIQTDLFEDSDEHIRISVDQLMSDGRSLYASVHYQALDDVGKEWLARKTEYIYYSLGFRFDGEDKGTAFEIVEQRTETDKYFYVRGGVPYELWGADKSELNGSFGYSLPTDLIVETDMDLSGTFDVKSYKIVGDERCCKYLTPTRLEISPLSYTLYANDDYGVGTWNQALAVSWTEFNNEVCHVDRALVMSDGEKILLPIGSPYIRDDGTYVWTHSDIFDYEGIESYYAGGMLSEEYNVEFDFDNLAGIEINGIYYELVEE